MSGSFPLSPEIIIEVENCKSQTGNFPLALPTAHEQLPELRTKPDPEGKRRRRLLGLRWLWRIFGEHGNFAQSGAGGLYRASLDGSARGSRHWPKVSHVRSCN